MNKIPKLVLEEYLLEPLPKVETIESMVNKEYIDNMPTVRKIIAEENKQNERAYEKIKDLIIN